MDRDTQPLAASKHALTKSGGGLRSSHIVGRSLELAAVAAVATGFTTDRRLSVALTGEAGVGKSRLRHEAEQHAVNQSVTVLSGRAVQRGFSDPYHPLAEALSRGFAHSGPPRDRELAPAMRTLNLVVPAWTITSDAEPPSVVGVAEALLRLLESLSRRGGAFLVLEDLHWADAETLRVVEYVVEHLDGTGARALLTARIGEAADVDRLVQRLADTRALDVVPVRPLSSADSAALVLECLHQDAAPEELVRFVVDRADGVPFLVEELLAGLERAGAIVPGTSGWQVHGRRITAEVPATFAATIERRFGALAESTRSVLSAASLLGRRFDWSLLPEMSKLPENTVLAGLREARSAGLVIGDGPDLQFRHALTCDAVRSLVLPPEQQRMAARSVRLLADRAKAGSAQHDLVAELARIAGDVELAAESLVNAAEDARLRGALTSATTRLEAVAALVPTHDSGIGLIALEQLAQVRALAGDVDGAFSAGEAALAARSRSRDAPGLEIDVHLALSRAALAAGRYFDASKQADAAIRLAEATQDRTKRLQGQVLVAEIAVASGDPGSAEAVAERVLAVDTIDRAEHADIRCAALEVLGRCRRLHDVAAAEASFAEALATADEHGLLSWRARALQELGTIDLFDTLRTDRLVAARRAAVEIGAPVTEAVAEMHLAAALLARGEIVDGRTSAERAATLSRRLGLALLPFALSMVARSWAQEQNQVQMERVLEEAAEVADGDPAAVAAGWSHARAMFALYGADRHGALAALDRANEQLRLVPGEHDPHRGLWALLSTVCTDDGAAARAEAAQASGSGTRFNRALLSAAEAVDAGRRGNATSAASGFDAAVDLLSGYESAEWMVHVTRWLAVPNAVADGWGEPAAWLDSAVRWFGSRGWVALATSCRVMLRDMGASVPRQGRGVSAVPADLADLGVTSREVDVLALLGHRLSNQEIADRLVLSPRTVEKHVSNLRTKTGRGGRTDLADLARESGLPAPTSP